MYVKFITIYN